MTGDPIHPETEWEYKIVRSGLGQFGKPAEFQNLLREEARAGWRLVEKFDDNRVRFKRPIRERENDSGLPAGVDAYRTLYKTSLIMPIAILAACLLVLTAAAVVAVLVIKPH